jgi:peptidoglycan-N-acetylglucosamine deacetylase
MRARMTLLWLVFLTATAAAETAPACWTPSDLAYHKGDERVQKAAARIAPPQRSLAEYSPTAQRGAVRRVKLTAGKKLVALTFDLCEQPFEISGYQGGIVDFCARTASRPRSSWAASGCSRTESARSS